MPSEVFHSPLLSLFLKLQYWHFIPEISKNSSQKKWSCKVKPSLPRWMRPSVPAGAPTGIQHQDVYWNFTYRPSVITAERFPKIWANPIIIKNLFIIYIIWTDPGCQRLVNSKRKLTHMNNNLKEEWKQGVKITDSSWDSASRYENKVKVTLESKGSPNCSQGGGSDHGSLSLLFEKDVGLPLCLGCFLWLGWSTWQVRYPGGRRACACTSVHVKKGAECREGSAQVPRKKGWHRSNRPYGIGCWCPLLVCVLDSASLLPKGALAAAELQFRIMHLLNIRRYPGEEV